MRNNGPKKIALVTLVVAVIGLTVAFAMLSSNLNISGSAYVDPVKWGIYFDELSDGVTYNKATLDANTKAEIMTDSNGAKTKIGNMNVNLSIPGDKVVYTVDLVNEGTIPVEIAGITKSDMKYDFITFKVTYTGTNDEVAKGDVIEAGSDGEPAIYNLTITINYDKELVNELPTEELQIGLSYELEFKQTENSVNRTTTTPKGCFAFPEVSGKLGDDITFRYYKINRKNYGIAIEGTGAMYENCNNTAYAEAASIITYQSNSYCNIAGYIMMKAIDEIKLENDLSDNAKNVVLSSFIAGKIAGMTFDESITREQFIEEFLQKQLGLSSEEIESVMMIYDNIPNLKSITMSEGITSLTNCLFFWTYYNTFKVPNSVTSANGAFDNAHFDNFYPGTGITVIDDEDETDLFSTATFKKIFLPKGITEIKRYGIDPSGDSIEYLVIPSTVKTMGYGAIPYDSFASNAVIVNETGEAFDWNNVLGTGTGEDFVTGEVTTSSGKTITIRDYR